MWTTENRPRYNRDKLRYPSDLTDEEWAEYSAADPARQARWPQAGSRRARGTERCDVCPEHGMRVALHSRGICRREARCSTASNAGSRGHHTICSKYLFKTAR